MDKNSLSSEDNTSRESPVSVSATQSRKEIRNNKPYKRPKPRFNQPSVKVAYTEKSLPVTLSTRVITYYHPIFTSTSGIDKFSMFVYQTYACRDKRLENAFSQSQLSYVSTLALTYRIYRLASRIGYGMMKPSFYSELEEISRNLVLPEPIAKYIEAVGKVPIPSGICLVPYAPTVQELSQHSGFLDLHEIMNVPEIPAPAISEGTSSTTVTSRGKLLLNSSLVGSYMMGAAIAAKFGGLFRKVDWLVEEGNLSFAVSFSEEDRTGKVIGYSPCEMEQVQCQLGACYRLRDLRSRDEWIGNNTDYRLVHTSDSFHENVFIVDTIMSHMLAR